MNEYNILFPGKSKLLQYKLQCVRVIISVTTVCFFEGETSNVLHRQGKNYFWTKQLVSFSPLNWAILGNVCYNCT